MSKSSVQVRLAVLEERLRAFAKALKLQAREYRRRLLELNHSHDKQVEDQRTFVSADKYSGFEKEIRAWQRSVDEKLSELSGRTGGTAGARAHLFQVITAAAAVIAVILSAYAVLGP